MKVRYFHKDKKVSVISKETPYALTIEKCASYMDLFLPNILFKNIKKCQLVLQTLLKYADGYERDDRIIVWKELRCWSNVYGYHSHLTTIFPHIFSFNIGIVCINPNDFNSHRYTYSLEQILSNEVYYGYFCNYWLKHYNYDDLFQALYDVSVGLASDGKAMPDELIEMILCQAFCLHNRIKL